MGLHIVRSATHSRFGGRRRELALDEVGGPLQRLVALGRAHEDPAPPAALDAEISHQPLDGARATLMPSLLSWSQTLSAP